MEDETVFREGDIVSWCGAEGVVTSALPKERVKRVRVLFGRHEQYFENGKLHGRHKETSLKLIERARQKFTKNQAQYLEKQLIKHFGNCRHDIDEIMEGILIED